MRRGSKGKYSHKQKRQAKHIAQGYRGKGLSSRESARRAWATVNKATGGGKKSGSGRKKSAQELKTRRKSIGRSAAATRKGRPLSLSERGRMGGLASGRSRRASSRRGLARRSLSNRGRTTVRLAGSKRTGRRSVTLSRSNAARGISRRMSNISRGKVRSRKSMAGRRSNRLGSTRRMATSRARSARRR
ncbi:MAG: transcriptional regulator [Proteobacteria bacterium]|nr:transcriptional regulator [Pseudomonadota bacterium]